MKRFLFIGIVLLGMGHISSFAQKGSYADDIYFSSKDAKKQAEAVANAESVQQENITNGNDNYENHGRSYESDDEGLNEDYGYASRIRRFSYPDYRVRYYSSFYDPFYDPWYSPYWGGSGVSVTIGWGNPWPYYGYGGGWSYGMGYGWGYPYYSPWYSPYYGGYGYGGGGYWAGYNDGYYNGYYGGGTKYRNVTYGPRLSTSRTSGVRSSGLRTADNGGGSTTGPRRQMQQQSSNGGLRTADPNSNTVRERRGSRIFSAPSNGLPDNAVRSPRENNNQVQQDMPSRSRDYGNRGYSRQPSAEQQQPSRNYEQPSYHRSENSAPSRSYERSSPSYERSSPSSSPSRSYGGGSGGGSRGGGRR